mgnify:FL=1
MKTKLKIKTIDLSNIIYIAIMGVVLAITFNGCVKEDTMSPSKFGNFKVNQSLEELLDNNFHCYRAEYPDSNTYHFNTAVNNDFLAAWNSPPSAFDLNDDQKVNTEDMLLNLTGFGNPQPEYPPFSDFTPFQTFGEGNTWLTYTGLNPDISFGWMHRTPYDEINGPTYGGYENIYTWTLDVVMEDGIIFYYFVEI